MIELLFGIMKQGAETRLLPTSSRIQRKLLRIMTLLWWQIGMIPASVYQFRAKNFYGMKDVQEVTVAPKTDLAPETASEILQEIPDQLTERGNRGNKLIWCA